MVPDFTISDVGSNLNSPQLKSALLFAERGWPVLPLHFPIDGACSCKSPGCSSVGKHPMTQHGFKDASRDKKVVGSWWLHTPQANLGIRTGKESGIVVLDVDPRHGGDESILALQREFGALPQTLSVRTGGNGAHYYFRHPGSAIANKVNIRPGLDFRGDGGYIVAPPSLHASQHSYRWDDPNVPMTCPNGLLES